MGILLGFAPFIVFAVLSTLSLSLGLWLAFAAAFVIAIRDFVESPSLRTLDSVSVVLFGVLTLFTGFVAPATSVQAVQFLVEISFFLLAAASVLLRRPLSAAYSHDDLPPGLWSTGAILRANCWITTAWTLAFAVMAAADAALVAEPRLPAALDAVLSLAALGLAIAFTLRYPARLAARKAAGGARRAARS